MLASPLPGGGRHSPWRPEALARGAPTPVRLCSALASPPIPRRRYRQGGNQCAHTGAAGKGTANQGAKGGAALTDKYGNLI